jgi:hypothetical protein
MDITETDLIRIRNTVSVPDFLRQRQLQHNSGVEHFFTCPYCWQTISMVLDLSVTEQTYVEDCEVCCHPIELHVGCSDETLVEFEACVLE